MKPELRANGQELTALSLFILRTIHRYGPQSDVSLQAHSRCETLKAVIIASAMLAEAEFIERTPKHKLPHRFAAANTFATYWQLTQKGQDHIAAVGGAAEATNAAQQEVCLGSK